MSLRSTWSMIYPEGMSTTSIVSPEVGDSSVHVQLNFRIILMLYWFACCLLYMSNWIIKLFWHCIDVLFVYYNLPETVFFTSISVLYDSLLWYYSIVICYKMLWWSPETTFHIDFWFISPAEELVDRQIETIHRRLVLSIAMVIIMTLKCYIKIRAKKKSPWKVRNPPHSWYLAVPLPEV